MAILTVLMPVYNAERFLRMAMESILHQTFTDFEFLIIDDCSTDSSVAIIQSYNDPRIRFYQNEKNLGISATLNRGIQLSSADWIARMDSDDVSYPQRLQKQYDFIKNNPDGALYSCSVKVVGHDGEFIRVDNFKSEYYYYNLTFICWIYHPTIIFNKKAVAGIGMYTVPYAEDFELFWQLSRTYKIYHVPEILMDYRVTDQSLHQVLKKTEYAKAQHEQLLRNFRYYVGADYNLPETYIECLQHNFAPLLLENNLNKIIDCSHQLELISEKILLKENINLDAKSVEEAAFFKRRFIIIYFADHLPWPKGMLLLIRLKEYGWLIRRFKNDIKKAIGIKR
ncbi:glycosyltransferase [soil metagenome]